MGMSVPPIERRIVNTVFDYFQESLYEFLEISRGGVYGNRITAVHDASGVFKLRSNIVQSNNQELHQSSSTLHIHPDEPFIADITVDGKTHFVGHGIRIDGVDYEIVGGTAGRNYDNGELEHYTLTLQNADYSAYTEGS